MSQPPVAPIQQNTTTLALAPTHPRVRRLADLAAVGGMAWSAYRKARGWYETRTQYRVSVEETDDLYPAVHAWLVGQVPAAERRSLTARTGRRDSPERALAPGEAPIKPALALFYDGQLGLRVKIAGHTVRVAVEERDGMDSSEGTRSWKRPDRVLFDCAGHDAREAVIEWLRSLIPTGTDRLPRLYVGTRWGHWSSSGDLPPRTLDTVVIADGTAEAIVADLGRFYDSEADYARLGVPWHRGYLFHGPPGTGKTSLARALATEFRLDVYWLPLSSVEGDDDLLRLMGEVPRRSLLLLEDIDVVHAAGDRDDAATKGITTAGLLNALDGIVTPHGLVTVMTTNRVEQLDDALIRPGRADMRVEVGYLDTPTARRLAARIVDRPIEQLDFEVLVPDLTAAELTSAAVPYLGNRVGMVRAVIDAATRVRPNVPNTVRVTVPRTDGVDQYEVRRASV